MSSSTTAETRRRLFSPSDRPAAAATPPVSSTPPVALQSRLRSPDAARGGAASPASGGVRRVHFKINGRRVSSVAAAAALAEQEPPTPPTPPSLPPTPESVVTAATPEATAAPPAAAGRRGSGGGEAAAPPSPKAAASAPRSPKRRKAASASRLRTRSPRIRVTTERALQAQHLPQPRVPASPLPLVSPGRRDLLLPAVDDEMSAGERRRLAAAPQRLELSPPRRRAAPAGAAPPRASLRRGGAAEATMSCMQEQRVAAKLCASQSGTLLWVLQRNGEVTLRGAREPEHTILTRCTVDGVCLGPPRRGDAPSAAAAAVARRRMLRDPATVCLDATDAHVFVGVRRRELAVFDAWTLREVERLRVPSDAEEAAFVRSVAGGCVAVVSVEGIVSVYSEGGGGGSASPLELVGRTRIWECGGRRRQTVTCADVGGRTLFLGTSLGEVFVVSCGTGGGGSGGSAGAPPSVVGKWECRSADEDPLSPRRRSILGPVAALLCVRGYVVAAVAGSGGEVGVWDPFPGDGTGRLAAPLPPLPRGTHAAGASVVGVVAAHDRVLSLDSAGGLCSWDVLDPQGFARVTLGGGDDAAAPPTTALALFGDRRQHCWQGTLVWAYGHDKVRRHLVLRDEGRLRRAAESLVAARAETETGEMLDAAAIRALPGETQRRLCALLQRGSACAAAAELRRRGFQALRRLREVRRTRRSRAEGVAHVVVALPALRWAYNALRRCAGRRVAARSRARECAASGGALRTVLRRRYYLKLADHAGMSACARRQKRAVMVVVDGHARTAGLVLVRRYYARWSGRPLERKLAMPSKNAAATLLKMTTIGYVRVAYSKWRKFAKQRCNQRRIIQAAMVMNERGQRLQYYEKWKRWAGRKRQTDKFDLVMRGMGDIGIIQAYFRRLKMYPSFRAMQEMESRRDYAAQHFKLLIEEEEELMAGNLAVQMQVQWPACAITSALGLNIEKWMREGMVFFAGVSQEYTKMHHAAQKLRQAWMEKPGDILTELAQNLVAPPCQDKEALLWELCKDLHKTYAQKFPEFPVGPIELLAMRLYTLEGPDVDRHMGFGDVPPPFSSVSESQQQDLKLQWDTYKKQHASVSKPTVTAGKVKPDGSTIPTDGDDSSHAAVADRNPSIYNEMNKALRTSEDLEKWAKLSSLLLALSMPIPSADDDDPAADSVVSSAAPSSSSPAAAAVAAAPRLSPSGASPRSCFLRTSSESAPPPLPPSRSTQYFGTPPTTAPMQSSVSCTAATDELVSAAFQYGTHDSSTWRGEYRRSGAKPPSPPPPHSSRLSNSDSPT
eukprot:Rhum_TRINITY_DN14409_c10_g3::Rhum_TRINITY_DN14409_c10_g3_i3::g.88386::m.88386